MRFELDHVFVAASPGAPESAGLEAAGFVEGPAHDHPGQGTASRGFFFENAYLELIWLTDRSVAEGEAIRRTGLVRRADPGHPSCPFGFGLRWPEGAVPDPPFATWRYAPPYVPGGAAFRMAANSERTDEPLVFTLPWSRRPEWEVPAHPSGARRITRVTWMAPAAALSAECEGFLDLGLIGREEAPGQGLDVELDGAARGARLDLRPALPLTLRW